MKIQVTSDAILFEFHPAEAIWVLNSFQQLQQSYSTPWESLDPKEKEYWSGNILDSKKDARSMKDEADSLKAERLEWKDIRLVQLNQWLKQFEGWNPTHPFELKIAREEADALLQITNDRRLILASLHEIQEEDMHHDIQKLESNPKAPVLLEIDFLAYLQSYLLQFLSES